MRHPRHRPRNYPYRYPYRPTPGRSLPHAPRAQAVRPPFAFASHPNADLIARVIRPHDGHEVRIILAPRQTIPDDADFAVERGEDVITLVVAAEYVDSLVNDVVADGMRGPDATRQVIEHLVDLAADVLHRDP